MLQANLKSHIIFYNVAPEILAGGTNCGRIALWRMGQTHSSGFDTKALWKLQTPTEIGGNVVQLQVLCVKKVC